MSQRRFSVEFSLQPGVTGEKQEAVTENNTAIRYGSGEVPVYATPALVGLMEGAAIRAVDPHLPEGFCTVGTSIAIEHTAATPVGMTVTARARLARVEGRKLTFEVEAFDDRERVGKGTHGRFIVQIEKFMGRSQAKRG